MIAMFRISLRNRRGIDRSASATSFSNAARSTGFSPRLRLHAHDDHSLAFARGRIALAGDDRPVVVAVVDDKALLAQRLRPADAAAMENQRVRRPGPALGRQRVAQL